MNTLDEVLAIVDEVLNLGPRAGSLRRETPLLGAIAELDSMAVMGILTLAEERFGFVVEDDEIDAGVFESVGTLVDFVEGKLR